MKVSQDQAREILAALKGRGLKHTERLHEALNYDEVSGRYLPSTYTSTICLIVEHSDTGNAVSREVSSVAEIDALLASAKQELRGHSRGTRRAMAAEKEAS